MAVQSGMAATKLLIVFGAGVTGSILMKNGTASDFVRDMSKVFRKYLQEDESRKQGDNDIMEAITAQVNRLSSELKHLASSRGVTVVHAGGSSSSNSLSSVAVPVIVVGIAGYGYFWWKGWSWTDVMYVTRRNMSNVVASVTKQLEQVTTAIAATKRHLTSRIDTVSKTLDDSVAVQGLIKNEVFEIRSDVARVGGDIGAVQQLVQGLGDQLEEVRHKQEFTNKGIILLCSFAQRWEESKKLELPASRPTLSLLDGESSSSSEGILQTLPPLPKSRLERSASATPPSASGLKELQSISEALSNNCNGEKSTLQRTLTRNWSFSNRLQKAS